MAETSDNHFLLSWTQSGNTDNSIWYAVLDTAGTSVLAPTAFTSSNVDLASAFNSLPDNRAILTMYDYLSDGSGSVHFAVIDSSGGIVKGDTQIGTDISSYLADAVALPGGKTAVGWPHEGGISYVILDSGFNLTAGPTSADFEPSALFSRYGSLSMTSGGLDRVVFQWESYTVRNEPAIFYALGNSNGTFITPPLVSLIQNVDTYLYLSENGQGIAPYSIYTISGNAGVGNATVNYTGGSTTADSSGDYSFTVPYYYSGTVTPSKVGYAFVPANRDYLTVDANQLNQNYTATAIPPTFADVPFDYSTSLGGVVYNLHDYIQALYDAGYTAGCLTSPLRYCPDNTMTRAESAVFMLRGQFGSGYVPPPEPWDTFADDWSPGTWAEKWAEGMWDAGLTAGCLTDPLRFCPWDQFPRVQAAVFGLKMKYGTGFTPDPALGTVFADMTDTGYWGTKWAEKAYTDGLLPACGTSGGKPTFCPNDLFTRAWGAYLIVKAKGMTPTP
jgi:hypothetical protein